jgi:predicted aconitase with swiveling domain
MIDRTIEIAVRILAGGPIEAPAMPLTAPISPWGGIDLDTGAVCDASHPENGAALAGRIVFVPGLKGSTAGPGALLELITAGRGPAAFVTPEPEAGLIAAVWAAALLPAPPPVLAVLADWTEVPPEGAACRLVAADSGARTGG